MSPIQGVLAVAAMAHAAAKNSFSRTAHSNSTLARAVIIVQTIFAVQNSRSGVISYNFSLVLWRSTFARHVIKAKWQKHS